MSTEYPLGILLLKQFNICIIHEQFTTLACVRIFHLFLGFTPFNLAFPSSARKLGRQEIHSKT